MIVRRRLRQKLEFLSDELATRIEPSDAELQSFLQTHTGLFQSEPLFSFRQIYFNPQLHGGNLHRDMVRTLENLERAGSRADTANLGDPFLVERSFENVSLSDVKKTFGDQFASAVAALQLGVWQGPIESGYGTHLVFVAQRSEGRLPALDEVRDQVRREWLDAKRKEATEKFYQAILSRYKVKIELPEEKKVAQVH
jgi:PPIC-type PPIASE domain